MQDTNFTAAKQKIIFSVFLPIQFPECNKTFYKSIVNQLTERIQEGV